MRILRTINFIDALIEASLMVAVPLLLVARNVDVAEIGLVLAVSPLIFLFFRLLFASISDLSGLKKFFMLNAVANMLSTLAYAFSTQTIGYSVGKVFEGVSSASIWAVNRTAVMNQSKERDPAVDTARITGYRVMAFAFATVAIGYIIQLLSFEIALFILTGLGLLNLLLSASIREKAFSQGKLRARHILSQLDFRKKSKVLIRSSFVLALCSIAGASLFRLVLPLYLQNQGFNYVEIGLFLALQWMTRGLSLFSAVRRLSLSRIVLFGCAAIAVSLVAIPFAPRLFIPLFIMVLGAGMGSIEILWEKLIFHATKGSKSISTDIGIVHAPPYLATFLSLAAGGFLIDWFGYPLLFVSSAAFYVAFLLLGLKIMNSPRK